MQVPQKRTPSHIGHGLAIAVTAVLVILLTSGIAYGVLKSAESGGQVDEGVLVGGVREFRIKAQQWYFSPGVIRVNPGDTVRFVVSSQDIMHGFAINELGFNLALSSGGQVLHEVTIPPDLAEGTYAMYCSIFCGIGHPYMKGTLIVGTPGFQLGQLLPYIASLGMGCIFAAFIIVAKRGGGV